MFSSTCAKTREGIYGVMGTTVLPGNQLNVTNGTAFMIAPGILATAAHFVHVESQPSKPIHSAFEAIRAPDVGQKIETATFLAEDAVLDLALLQLQNPRSDSYLTLEPGEVPPGTRCGSLGFPLAQVTVKAGRKNFNLLERFQGAYISAVHPVTDPSGRQLAYYETDALMYEGSSGCPGFLTDGRVVGMQVKSIVEGKKTGSTAQRTRLAISLWVRSPDIIAFAAYNGVTIAGPSAWRRFSARFSWLQR